MYTKKKLLNTAYDPPASRSLIALTGKTWIFQKPAGLTPGGIYLHESLFGLPKMFENYTKPAHPRIVEYDAIDNKL